MDAFLARQPIMDQQQRVYGYELLFRSGTDNFFSGVNGEFASASVISDALHLHGLDKITNGARCFINFTRQSLLDELYAVLPCETTVIELKESIQADDAAVRACRRARDKGYSLALEDYKPEPRLAPLLPFLDMLKVDFASLSESQHRLVAESSRQFGLELVAEKVEDPEQFRQAIDCGYNYFQGYFFCRPQLIQSKRLPASQIQQIRLLRCVHDSEFLIDEVEELIRQDVGLSYKLIRYLNSPLFSLRSKVESIRHAITILGQTRLRQWVMLLTVGELSSQKPAELLNTCLIRARFCESIAAHSSPAKETTECFTMGLFSLLDAMLDQPMSDLVNELDRKSVV